MTRKYLIFISKHEKVNVYYCPENTDTLEKILTYVSIY